MPSISSKGLKMPESPIRKLVPYAEKAAKSGKEIYYLNIGQPDIKSPKVALDAVANHQLETLAYSRSEGSEEYREKIAAYYNRNNIPVAGNDIIVTTGGSEALLFAMGTICDQDDEIIIPEPFYANYNGFATASGVNIVPVISKIENNFALPPISEFEKLISPKTKAIIICNPGNPTGYLYSKEEIKKLASIVLKHNLFLVADEVYREFTYDGEAHYSILQEESLADNGIIIDSVSKRYSMCGARIGCLVSKNKEVISTALKFAQARLSPPTLGQIAGEAALKTPRSYFDKVSKEYVERRDIIVNGLNNINGVICPKPQGAFYAIAQLPIDDADHFCQWILESFNHKGNTVMMAPASGFYANSRVKNQVRIAYVLEKKHLTKAVECIKMALKIYKSQKFN